TTNTLSLHDALPIFSFISTVEFDVAATGLPTVRIAEATIPAGVSTVDLTLDNQDIAAYVKADSFSITTKGTGHSPVHDTTIEARSEEHTSELQSRSD